LRSRELEQLNNDTGKFIQRPYMKKERLELWQKVSLEYISFSLPNHNKGLILVFNCIIVGITKFPHVYGSRI
jgi:hypothetical protein